MKILAFFLFFSSVAFADGAAPIMQCQTLETPPQFQVQIYSLDQNGNVNAVVTSSGGIVQKYSAQYQAPGTTAICGESPCYGGVNFTLIWTAGNGNKDIQGSLTSMQSQPAVIFQPVLCEAGN